MRISGQESCSCRLVFFIHPDHIQPKSSKYKFEPSKNNILSSLDPMDENPKRNEQVEGGYKLGVLKVVM